MGAGYFIIAIMGCGDGLADCVPVATAPARYESAAACSDASADVLARSTDLDFPTLVAECRSTAVPAAAPAEREPPKPSLVLAARG